MLRFRRDRFLDVAPITGNNRIGPTGRLEIPGAVAEGLQIGADVRVYRGAAGELYLVPLAGQQVVLPNEGLQIGADLDIWRDVGGNMTFADVAIPGGVRLSDLYVSNIWKSEMLGSTSVAPWTGAAVGAGTIANKDGTADHPGVLAFSCTAAANTGYRFAIRTISACNSMLIAGGERSAFIFNLTNLNNKLGYMGFVTTFSPGSGTANLVALRVTGGNLDGICQNAAGSTTTGTNYALNTGVWYRAQLVVNAAASRVDFTLYDCATGAVLWTDNVQANIPTAAGREVGHIFGFYDTVGGAAGEIVQVDYIDLEITRALVR